MLTGLAVTYHNTMYIWSHSLGVWRYFLIMDVVHTLKLVAGMALGCIGIYMELPGENCPGDEKEENADEE